MGLGRSLVAVIVGAIIGIAVTLGIQLLSTMVFPVPPVPDPADPGMVPSLPADVPIGAHIALVLSYLMGATTGAASGARVAPSHPMVHAILVGLVFVGWGISSFMTIRHPLWVIVASCAMFLVAPFIGAKFGEPTVIHRRRSR